MRSAESGKGSRLDCRVLESVRIPADSILFNGTHSFSILAMFGKSLRSTFTKFTSGAKEMANKTMSAMKHKGNLVDIPDQL